MPTTITCKGQITIPAEIRKLPGYGPGDKVSIHRDIYGRIIIESLDDWLLRVQVPISPDRQLGRALTDEEMDEIVAQAVVEDYLNEDVSEAESEARRTHAVR